MSARNGFVINREVNLKVGQYAALKINNNLTVQIKREAEGFVIDALAEDERDNDVIDTMTVWNDDIENCESE